MARRGIFSASRMLHRRSVRCAGSHRRQRANGMMSAQLPTSVRAASSRKSSTIWSSAILVRAKTGLTLNVWAPAGKPKQKLPVMVWIYGGGFAGGGTSEPRQDGEHLASKGVLVVSMNYRLGIFGFLATHDLAAEDPHHAAGNYGLMDELAAIQWVKRNIAEFGGDPNNVTIFGESAGSFAVSAQMASPLAKGLFAHAIGESGGAFASKEISFPPLEQAQKSNEDFLRRAGANPGLAALRALSSEDVLKLGRTTGWAILLSNPTATATFCPKVFPQFLPPAARPTFL